MHLMLCHDVLGCYAYTDWLRDQGREQEASFLMEIFQQGESGYDPGPIINIGNSVRSELGQGHGRGYGRSSGEGYGYGIGYGTDGYGFYGDITVSMPWTAPPG